MFKLLNRISYLVSFIMGFIICFIFISFDSYNLNSDIIISSLVFGIVVGLIFKKLFLSKKFIESRLQYFADTIKSLEKTVSPKVTTYQKQEQPLEEIKEFKLEEKLFEKEVEFVKSTEKVSEPSKFELAIKSFFAENLLAKLGGILVFLGVLFLLSLVYTAIGPVGKLIIGFSIGFAIYFAGVLLEKKDYKNEGKILIGVGILINYLVILGGRYLIGDSIDNNLLSIWTTFIFLIFNTLFAVVTSLVYQSRTLLLFSFIFAFLNPLLIGGNGDNPYTLVGYSLIVAFGGLFLSLKQKDLLLTIGIFILSNILFLVAPMNLEIHWIIKLVSSAIISIFSIGVVYKIDSNKVPSLLIGAYIFLMLLLGTGNVYIKETTSFISYMITIVLYFSVGLYFFLKTSINSILFLLFSPILIILGLCFSGLLINIASVLALVILVYLVGFVFVKDKLRGAFKYFFFIVLGIYIFLINLYLTVDLFNIKLINLDLLSFITVIIVSFVFIYISYYLSTKKNLEFLYTIGTIGGIFTLAPLIVSNYNNNETQFYISIISLSMFAISNWILPFINENLTNNRDRGNIKNLLIGVIAGLLFIGFEIFNYGSNYFPGVTLGLAYAILAIIYFILANFMLGKIGIETIKKQEFSKNVIYTYLGVSISIFSLAIALVFSKYEEVVSAVWLFEATLMFYFYYKTNESKIFSAGIILFLIGVVKLALLVDIVRSKDYIFLVSFSLIFISYVLNVKFLDSINSGIKRGFHDILHIIGIGTLGILLLEIIPSTGQGWSTLGIIFFLFVANFVYSYFSSKILKIFFMTIFTAFLFLQVSSLDSIFWKIDTDNMGYLRVLQYLTTLIVGLIVLFWNKINKQGGLNVFVNIIFSFYLLIITSAYIYDIFNSTFAVTIYWGVTASILLFYGIANDFIKLRTIGLYLISITTLKIFLYDIWYGIDDAVSRVVAFIVIGILLIIISTRYTKKYGNNLSGEFKFSNFFRKNNGEKFSPETDNSKEDMKYLINEKIKDIDVSNLRGVKFIINGGNTVEIRAENMIKIVKMITKDFQDNDFNKGELTETYEFVVSNYKSELSKPTYDKIVDVLKQFVDNGGRVEGIYKK